MLKPKLHLRIEERLDWGKWAVPKKLLHRSVHRWFVFPHSFTDDLVAELSSEWKVGTTDLVLDPFVGAGTTVLAAKQKGISATGYDLSPLAVMVSRVKATNYNIEELSCVWGDLSKQITYARGNLVKSEYADLITRAFPVETLKELAPVSHALRGYAMSDSDRDFFRLALLAILPGFSKAVSTGGWLSWVEQPRLSGATVLEQLSNQVELMLGDLRQASPRSNGTWTCSRADIRSLPDPDNTYSAVITSPPYPNRHDYTRVFGIELLFDFLDWTGLRDLRYQSFHSHPESRPQRPSTDDYQPPELLTRAIEKVETSNKDRRIPRMLHGYFIDIHLALREMQRVCRSGARIGLVVGNAQYAGVPILVDEFVAEIGTKLGLICEQLIVIRYRGNSAQQMGRLGRHPSRESVVVFLVLQRQLDG